MQFDKCEFLLNKWIVCSFINRKLPLYEKQEDCYKYYDRFMEECYEQQRSQKPDKVTSIKDNKVK